MGGLFVDERTLWPNGQFVIGLLVVNTKFLKEHPDLVKNWIRANVDLTDWINSAPGRSQEVVEPADSGRDRQGAASGGSRRSVRAHAGHLRSAACRADDCGDSRPLTTAFWAGRCLISRISTICRC